MKMKVTDRDDWNSIHQATFGKYGDVYDFPETTREFLELVKNFGRFEILETDNPEIPEINFQSSYD
jgi:hypothetical protein